MTNDGQDPVWELDDAITIRIDPEDSDPEDSDLDDGAAEQATD